MKEGKKAIKCVPHAKKKERMMKVISQLRKKMAEFEKLKKDIDYKPISFNSKPKQTRMLIEEIKLPTLELIKDEGAKKK